MRYKEIYELNLIKKGLIYYLINVKINSFA